MRCFRLAITALVIACAMPAIAGTVDSGSFGIYVGGKRVATETFKVEEAADGNTVTSRLVLDDSSQAAQTAELDLAKNGDLKHYIWREEKPGKSEISIEPSDQFLIENVRVNATDPPKSQTHPLLASTTILDDNFFVQREVLTWRYMATGCKPGAGVLDCSLLPQKFPILVPHQHESMTVTMQLIGAQTVSLHGKPQELVAFSMSSEAGSWTIYMDQSNHLVRIVIPDENTEVVRD
jgi:hypothetical protein